MLNCVGGKIIPKMASLLGSGAYVVTYGAMSKEPVVVSTSSLIFKDIQYHGFWSVRLQLAPCEAERPGSLMTAGKVDGTRRRLGKSGRI